MRLSERLALEANLRIPDVQEIKTVPYAPLSHPFVERLIGTIRRDCLDRTILGGRRFGGEALRVSELLQHISRPCGVGRATASIDSRRGRPLREPRFVPLAAALRRALSHADRGLRCRLDASGSNRKSAIEVALQLLALARVCAGHPRMEIPRPVPWEIAGARRPTRHRARSSPPASRFAGEAE